MDCNSLQIWLLLITIIMIVSISFLVGQYTSFVKIKSIINSITGVNVDSDAPTSN